MSTLGTTLMGASGRSGRLLSTGMTRERERGAGQPYVGKALATLDRFTGSKRRFA